MKCFIKEGPPRLCGDGKPGLTKTAPIDRKGRGTEKFRDGSSVNQTDAPNKRAGG